MVDFRHLSIFTAQFSVWKKLFTDLKVTCSNKKPPPNVVKKWAGLNTNHIPTMLPSSISMTCCHKCIVPNKPLIFWEIIQPLWSVDVSLLWSNIITSFPMFFFTSENRKPTGTYSCRVVSLQSSALCLARRVELFAIALLLATWSIWQGFAMAVPHKWMVSVVASSPFSGMEMMVSKWVVSFSRSYHFERFEIMLNLCFICWLTNQTWILFSTFSPQNNCLHKSNIDGN